jgi:hypothetical protein
LHKYKFPTRRKKKKKKKKQARTSTIEKVLKYK